eukprot:6493717-Pyramimonas_sp.AAC.1
MEAHPDAIRHIKKLLMDLKFLNLDETVPGADKPGAVSQQLSEWKAAGKKTQDETVTPKKITKDRHVELFLPPPHLPMWRRRGPGPNVADPSPEDD